MNYRKFLNSKVLSLIVIALCFSVVSIAQTPDFSGLKVCIDPGHSGHESDDRGMSNGFWESESNLTKGLWLRDLLEARGCEVFITRTTNSGDDEVDDLPLSQRAQLANDNNVDLFISIHSNAGNQVSNYPLTIFNGKSDNPAIPEAKQWAIILWEQLISNQATYWSSISEHYIGDLTLNPTFTYGYGVLYPLEIPGIISEGSFHDYKPEVERLLNTDYRKQEAWNIYYAMVNYFQLVGNETYGQITGIIRDSLLVKESYNIPNSTDKYEVVKNTRVEIIESGQIYEVGDTANAQWYFSDNTKTVDLNAGFYYFDSITPGYYHLVFSAPGYFNDTIEIEVKAHEFTYWNEWLKADKTMAPKLVSTSIENGATIKCFDAIGFTFNMNMDSASFADAFSITPEIQGSFSWDSDYLKVFFQPVTPFNTNTNYSILIDSTAQHQWGVGLDTVIILEFTTDSRNRYEIETSFPTASQVNVSPYLQFRIIFDAPIKNSSLIDAVTIVDENNRVIGTKGAKITIVDEKGHYYFSSADVLEYDKLYTLKLAGTIQDENNIPMVNDVEIPFSTMSGLGNMILVNGFEEIDPWYINYTSSIGIDESSFLYKWTKEKMEGNASMLLRYNFADENSVIEINAGNGILVDSKSLSIGMWVWGDMSYNKIAFEINDKWEQSDVVIDFAGWKYISTIFAQEDSLKLTKIALRCGEKQALSGDIYFDFLSQPEPVSLSLRNEIGLHVFPNPVINNKIYISGLIGFDHAKFVIVNELGQLLQKGTMFNSNEIELSASCLKSKVLIISIIHSGSISNFLLFNQQNK